ncbi:hypothetical protein [Wenyingzhuangia sp. IMCC45574]
MKNISVFIGLLLFTGKMMSQKLYTCNAVLDGNQFNLEFYQYPLQAKRYASEYTSKSQVKNLTPEDVAVSIMSSTTLDWNNYNLLKSETEEEAKELLKFRSENKNNNCFIEFIHKVNFEYKSNKYSLIYFNMGWGAYKSNSPISLLFMEKSGRWYQDNRKESYARFYIKGFLFDKIKMSVFGQIVEHQNTDNQTLNIEIENLWEDGVLNLNKLYERVKKLQQNKNDPATELLLQE